MSGWLSAAVVLLSIGVLGMNAYLERQIKELDRRLSELEKRQ